MRTIHLSCVILDATEGATVTLEEEFKKCLVFYPVADPIGGGYLNMPYLSAAIVDKLLHCKNTDETFEHELWIIQFNPPLPPIFKIEPWQILIEQAYSG